MKVILLKKVNNLGNAGEVKEVSTGYARNYLLPQGTAVMGTPTNLKHRDKLPKGTKKRKKTAKKSAKQ